MKRYIIIFALVLVLGFTVFGCSATQSKSPAPSAYVNNSAPYADSLPPQENTGASYADSLPPQANTGAQYADSPSPQANTDSSGIPESNINDESAVPLPLLRPSDSRGKILVYTVELKLQTTEFMAGIRTLLNTVSDMGGYVESAYIQGRDLRSPEQERRANYTLRLRSEHLPEFLVVVEDNYNLLSLRQTTADETANYKRADSSLAYLREQEARILKDLENTKVGTREKLDLERKLGEVQSSIALYETQQSAVDDNVIYSTANVELQEVILPKEIEEVEEVAQTFKERVSESADKSVSGFVAFWQGFLIVLIKIAPTVVVIAVLAVIALLIYKGIKAYKEKRGIAQIHKKRVTYNAMHDGNDIGYNADAKQDDSNGPGAE